MSRYCISYKVAGIARRKFLPETLSPTKLRIYPSYEAAERDSRRYNFPLIHNLDDENTLLIHAY